MTKGTQITLTLAVTIVIIIIGLSAYQNRTVDSVQITQPGENALGTSTPATTTPGTDGKIIPPGGNTASPATTAGQSCVVQGGTWSEQYKECAGIGKAACSAIGGTFDECASPCRNDPNAQACILMCVQVCTVK